MESTILYQLDQILSDKDAFIVKLPNKFKDHLTDDYKLGSEGAQIGKIVPNRKRMRKQEWKR